MSKNASDIAAGLTPEYRSLQGGIVRDYTPTRYDFGEFDEHVHQEVRAMFRETQWFVNDVVHRVRPRRWLSLLGGSGVGKTHLAYAAARVIRQERRALLTQAWKWARIVDMLRNGEWPLVGHLCAQVDVLVLDDVGAENRTPAIISALNRIADARLGKWTIVTSNLLPSHIGDELDVRIASRLFRGGNVVCKIEQAPDYCFEQSK